MVCYSNGTFIQSMACSDFLIALYSSYSCKAAIFAFEVVYDMQFYKEVYMVG